MPNHVPGSVCAVVSNFGSKLKDSGDQSNLPPVILAVWNCQELEFTSPHGIDTPFYLHAYM